MYGNDYYYDEWDAFAGVGMNEPYQREMKKIGRNDPCPCGSGKKYKKCCGRQDIRQDFGKTYENTQK